MLRPVLATLLVCLFFSLTTAQKLDKKTEVVPPKTYKVPVIEASPSLQTDLDNAVSAVIATKGFKPQEVAAL